MNDPHRDQPVLRRGEPLESASGAIVFVHGRGASARDILELAPEISSPGFAFLAPEAANHEWYPYSFLAPLDSNEPWLTSALRKLDAAVKEIIASVIPKERIVILGFSQGACLATEYVARNPARYGALISFTGGVIGPPDSEFQYEGSVEGMPVFLGSSDPDPHVPWDRVRESADILNGLGANVSLRRYPGMAHTINCDELAEAKNLIASV